MLKSSKLCLRRHSLRPAKRLLVILCSMLLCISQAQLSCWADTIDLGSANQTTTANGTGTITENGQSVTITAGSHITAAQSVALTQVLAGGTQTIQLDASGAAIGGTLSLNSLINPAISNLVIPTGVTAIQDFGAASTLNITGTITNSGTLYAISTDSSVLTATINTGSLVNSGLISSVLPDGGLSGYSNLLSSLNLAINAINNIFNSGSIMSSGSLSMSASSIMNSGTLSAMTNLSMSAASIANLGNIVSQSGTLAVTTNAMINNGTLQATLGDVIVRDLLADGLRIDNTSGVISAGHNIITEIMSTDSNKTALDLLGGSLQAGNDINLTASIGDIRLTGGDFISNQLNVQTPQGSFIANVGELTGTLNVSGQAAHVFADTHTLVLGNNCLTGDPTYVSTGDIQINGTITASEDLALIAAGNIYIPSTATASISTTGTNGSNITLIAGAQVTCAGCSTSTGAPTGATSIGSGNTANVNLGAGSGGYIDLSTNNSLGSGGTVINSASNSAGNGNGGNVTLIAHANGANTGYVLLPSTSVVDSSGKGTGSNGNVTIYAGGTNGSGTGISTGAITTSTGATGGGGTTTLSTSQATGTPSFNNAGTMSGTVSAGTINTAAALSTGNVSAGGAAINIQGGANVATGALTSAGGTATVSSSTGTIDIDYGSSTTLGTSSGGTALVLSSPGEANVNGTNNIVLGPSAITMTGGGNLFLTTPASADFRPAISANSTALSNSAGTIYVNAGAIDLSSTGTLSFTSAGNLGYGFYTSVELQAGSGGILFPSGSLTLNFNGPNGSGVEFDSSKTVNSFPGLSTTNLTINSAGDVHFAGPEINQGGGSGSINVTTPAATAFYSLQMDSYGTSAVNFSNINVINGTLALVSDGRITISGNLNTSGTPYQDTGGITIISGFDYTYGVTPPTFTNTEVGIVVNPGVSIIANPGFILLSVVNVQTSPPADPGTPVISIGTGAQVLSYGAYLNGTDGMQSGGGVQLSVNSPLGTTTGLSAGLQAQRPSLSISQLQGTLNYIDNVGGVTSFTDSPSISQTTPGGVTLTASNDGLVVYANGGSGTPNLLSGSGTVVADGGLAVVGGRSYDNEMSNNGTVGATLGASYNPPTPPPPPPPPVAPPAPPPPALPPVDPPPPPPPPPSGGSGPVTPVDSMPVPVTPAATTTTTTPTPTTTVQTQSIPMVSGVDARYQVANNCAVFSILPAKKLTEDKFAKYRGEAPVVMTFAGTTLKAEEPNESDLKNGIMNLTIQEGRVLIIGGSFNLIVSNRYGTRIATIPPKSTVVVEVRGSAFSIGNLADTAVASAPGHQTPVLAIADSHGGIAKEIPVTAGTNQMVTEDEEELIPTDGMSDATVVAKLTVVDSNLTVNSRKIIDKQKFMARNDRVTCNLIDTQSADRDLQRMRTKLKELKMLAEDGGIIEKEQLKTQRPGNNNHKAKGKDDHHIISAALLTPMGAEPEDGPLRPVAFHSPIITTETGLGNTLLTNQTPKGLIKALPNTEYTTLPDGTIELKTGDLLLETRALQKVAIGKGIIEIASGAIVLISRNGDATEICNLWESPSKSITVKIYNSVLHLSCGQEAIVVGKRSSISEALLKANYGRRGNKVTDLPEGSNLITGDVSLHSVLYVNKLLHGIAMSPSKVDKQIADKVIKMTAILTVATAGRGRFEFVTPPH